MPTNIKPVIIEHIGVSQGAISRIIHLFRERGSLIQGLCEHLLKTITPKEKGVILHIMRRTSFLATSVIRVALIRQTGRDVFVCTVQRCLVVAVYRSRNPDRCPRLTPVHHRRRRILVQRPQNWNHQHWYRVLFAVESIVSLYICNEHARVFVV